MQSRNSWHFMIQITLRGSNPANICWSWRRLQHVFSVTILRVPRRLEDVLQRRFEDVLKTSWRGLEDLLQDVLEDQKLLRWRRLQDVLKTSLEDVLKTYLEDFFKTSRRQTKFLLVMSVSNKSKCVSSKSMFHKSMSDKSKANPKCLT